METETVEEVIAESNEVEEVEEVVEVEEVATEEVISTEEKEPEEAEEVVVVIDKEPQEEAPQWVKDLRKQNREQNKTIRKLEGEIAKTASASKDVELGKKPHPDDYEYGSSKYEQDLEGWIDRKRLLDEKGKKQKEQEQEKAKSWQGKLDEYDVKKSTLKVKNFDEIEDNVRDALSLVQQGIIIDTADKPELVMLAVGTNPVKAKELASITNPAKFAHAIGRLESTMKVKNRKAETSPEKVVKSTGGSSSVLDKKLDKLMADADKTGDRSALVAYKRKLKEK